MASSSLGSSLIIKVYLHVVICSIGLAGCSVVTRLCLKTPDPKFCLSAIASSNPETDIDDLEILGVISIDSALANATAAFQFIQELIGFAPNVRVKARLRRCAKLYAHAIDILQQSNEDYKKDYDTAINPLRVETKTKKHDRVLGCIISDVEQPKPYDKRHHFLQLGLAPVPQKPPDIGGMPDHEYRDHDRRCSGYDERLTTAKPAIAPVAHEPNQWQYEQAEICCSPLNLR
ncbi:hypothetical protein RJ639_045318 [Escallonia herrerae]|uniref:Pectinesterase inhibitor domain-containing protein n=1 Tax=Escallonia herrerae TaxID=1293975 RepID=A0AA89B291_9ASTE|nr:hypothetical protein RJ639_045318 [Escallonia herrerae]